MAPALRYRHFTTSMLTFPRSRSTRGFTLAEMAVVLAIVSLLTLIGVPQLLAMLERQKLVGAARQTVQMLQRARMESIRRSAPVRVVQTQTFASGRPADSSLLSFVDVDTDGVQDADEVVLGTYQLPKGLTWQSPGDLGTSHDGGAINFPGAADADGTATFMPDGSVVFADASQDAALRISDASAQGAQAAGDPVNCLEVRIESPITAKMVIQKYFDPYGSDVATKWFADGELGDCHGNGPETCQWIWN